MKPKLYDTEILKDMKVGEVVVVLEEFVNPEEINKKFSGFLMGKVEYNMDTYYISINKTSYGLISAVYGSDTKDWVGKNLIYRGEKPCGKMVGKIWEAEEAKT